jgi:hypothetical protein
MPKNPLLNPTPRIDRYAGCTCAVDGCSRPTRPMSRYCTIHYQRNRRTRHPTGYLPSRKELKPFKDLARVALDEWGYGEQPAVLAAEAYLQRLVANPGDIPPKYLAHFRRLHLSGVTGRQMLLEMLAVYGIRFVGHPGSTHYSDATFHCSLGSRFLRTAPLGNKRPDWFTGRGSDQYRPSGTTCENVGYAIATKLGAMPVVLWRAIDEEQRRRLAEELEVRDALIAHPL